MVFSGSISSQSININVNYVSGMAIVSIGSGGDISNLVWNFNLTLPTTIANLNTHLTQISFPKILFDGMKLSRQYNGIYLGQDIQQYLSSPDSLFGTLIQPTDPTPFIIGLLGIGVSSIVVGVLATSK